MSVPDSTPSTNGSLARTREIIRRRQAVNQSTSATSSTSIISAPTVINTRASAVLEDHNYNGEPGPSTLRHSRRIVTLSRHQRNPDELDIPINNDNISSTPLVDPLRLPDNISGRLRQRATTASGFSNSSSHRNAANTNDVSDDEQSDPDDDKPLHLMVGNASTAGSSMVMRGRPPRITPVSVPTSSRVIPSRSQKRPYYNEESDESISTNSQRRVSYATRTPNTGNHQSSKRRLVEEDIDDENDSPYYPAGGGTTATNGRLTRRLYTSGGGSGTNNLNLNSNSDENDDDDDDDDQVVSVSSRGRVRKISSKVKNYFRE